jgi:hypothetical protein
MGALAQPPTSQRSYSQQVVLELVRPNIIEDLCALLFMAADDEMSSRWDGQS